MRTNIFVLASLLVVSACSNKDAGGGDDTEDGSSTTEPTEPVDLIPFYSDPPQNLLFISIDTYRRDYMARYGNAGGDGLTPFMDNLARQSVALDNHTSCSAWTFPSMMCALNGMTNVDAAWMPKLSKEYRGKAPTDRWTLGKQLQDAGFYTAFVTSNSWLSEDWLNDQGYTWQENPSLSNATEAYEYARDHLLANVDIDNERWFLHFHIKEPHAAYNPPDQYLDALDDLPPYEGYDLSVKDEHYDIKGDWSVLDKEEQQLLKAHLLARYAGEMLYMDDQLADIWQDLSDQGMLDDTLVVFFTDHGEEFWEHGVQTHAYNLFREQNDTIAFFWRKNLEPKAWKEPTTHIDIPPTVLKALGLSVPENVVGLPVGDAERDRPIFGEVVANWGVVQSVMVDGLKLQYRWNTGDKWLTDMNTDPTEQSNLYDSDDPRVLELWDLLQPKVDRMGPLSQEYDEVDPGP